MKLQIVINVLMAHLLVVLVLWIGTVERRMDDATETQERMVQTINAIVRAQATEGE